MANKFNFKIYTSDGKTLTDEIDILNVVSSTGALGILAHHLPMVAILEISHFNYKKNGVTYYFAIGGGVLNITHEGVTILADSFEAGNEIDYDRAEKAKQRAESKLSSSTNDLDYKKAEIALKKAINRLSMRQ